MTPTDPAVRAQVANLSAHIVTNKPGVAEWVRRYFGSWWRAEVEPVGAHSADVHMSARVDHRKHGEIASVVDAVEHEAVLYARKEMRVAHTGNAITAHSVDGVAYIVADGSIGIAGTDPAAVGSAACRLAREALRGLLARDGWVLLHASAVVRQGRAYLACGTKGSGKTATALQLAHATDGALLANDRVFARADADGAVVVLPWPAAAAVGLGLLTAAGWYDRVAGARDELHPTTVVRVLDALGSGVRTPVRHGERELKPQLYPDQIPELLGVPLATSGAAFTLLFPTVDPAAAPSVMPGGRKIGVNDTFAGREEDRYPNVFGLRAPEPNDARDAVFRALNTLPRLTVTLGHDVAANMSVLGELD